MAQSDQSLETDQQPPEENQPTSLKDRPDEQYQATAIIKRVPDQVHTASSEHHVKEEVYWGGQVYWQRITALATIAAFAVAAIYAYFAHQQVARMQAANDLNTALLRGTQAATLLLGVNDDWEHDAVGLVGIDQGKLMARALGGEIEIVRESFPDSHLLHRDHYTFGGDITVQTLDTGRLSRSFQMVGFTKAEQDAIMDGREMVTVSGTVHYDNGLGETVTQSFCEITVRVQRHFGFEECKATRQWLDAVRREQEGQKQKENAQ